MVRLLVKLFVKNSEKTDDPDVREAYGTLAGTLGIALNLLLFAAKYIAGTLAASIAVMSDAFNNLSDAGSSLITLFGFKLAGRKPHSNHPFGHGRWEYIAGLIVSLLIIMMGFTLAKESVTKIFRPEDVEFNRLSAGILAVSVLVKLYMNFYNRSLGKKINSVAMLATATDSLSDAVATSVVLLSMVVAKLTGLRIDGYAGTLVALMILWAGVKAARDTISPLLGVPPEPALIAKICDIVRSYDIVTGIHDLVIHDYGAGRRMISLHAEVPADGDIMETHDAIDRIERELAEKLNCHAVIHMDPVATDDELVRATCGRVLEAIHRNLGDDISIHDFRMVPGPTHTNVIFDAVLSLDRKMDADETKRQIEQIVREMDGNYNAVVNIDISYVL